MNRWIFLLAVLPAISFAQVYKCETADGIVFSDQKCATDAEEVALESETGGLGVAPSNEERVELLEKRLDREEQRYVGRLYEKRNRELKSIDAQIAALRRDKARANNNLAGATYASGIDQQIAALQQSRTQVQATYRNLITQAELDDR